MATVTWRHYLVYANDQGVAWLETASPNPIQFGGYAEAANPNSPATHDTCTPSQGNTGHESGLCPIAGTSVVVVSGVLHASVGFSAAPGSRIRAHVWDVT